MGEVVALSSFTILLGACQGQEQTLLLGTTENQTHYILDADEMNGYFENLFR